MMSGVMIRERKNNSDRGHYEISRVILDFEDVCGAESDFGFLHW